MRAEVNAMNVDGFTALDVILQKSRKSKKNMKLEGILRCSGAKRAKDMHRTRDNWTIQPLSPQKNRWKKHIDWLNETRSAIMVVAILISTITFQAGINPPGGVWQDDKIGEPALVDPKKHTAGESIMADKYPNMYISFTIFNAIAFIASLIIIILLIGGFPLKRRIFMWALMIITWLSVSSLIVTYGLAFYTVTTGDVLPTEDMLLISILGWLALNGLLIAAHFLRLAKKVTILIYTCIYRNKQPSKDVTNVKGRFPDTESSVEHD